MSTGKDEQDRVALLQGTLDLLILRTLLFGPQHGHGITLSIQRQSDDTLLVDHGSLYPALQRLEDKGGSRPLGARRTITAELASIRSPKPARSSLLPRRVNGSGWPRRSDASSELRRPSHVAVAQSIR